MQNKLILIVLLLFMHKIKAQDFNWKSSIPSIQEKGFYTVLIPANISAKSNDLNDLRIFDSDNKEIPYIFNQNGHPSNQRKLTKVRYEKINPSNWIQVDSNEVKQTFIKIMFDDPMYIDSIYLAIGSPKLYLRNLEINTLNGEGEKILFEYSTLKSNNKSGFSIKGIRTNEIILKIDNQDDNPLQIEKIEVFQLTRSIIAFLEPEHAYKLLIGNENLHLPNYDLKYFKDSIPENISEIYPNELTINQGNINSKTPIASKNDMHLLWLVLIFILIILTIYSYKILKEKK